MNISPADFLSRLLLEDAHDNPLGMVALKAVVVYTVGLILVRIGKSRLISRASPLDVLLGFILGSLLSRGITGSASITGTTVASIVLIAMHWLFTWIAYKSHTFGQLIKGHTRPIIKDGQLLRDVMRESHISEQDLLEQLRLHANLEDPKKVKIAYKERSGEVGVVKLDPQPHVIEIAVREGVQTVRIELVV
jgi:uncharacterized membrane protein YcaP (DUF421 family)